MHGKESLFYSHQHVEGGNVDHHIVVIVQPLMQQGGFIKEETITKLICFGVDVASFFQCYGTRVTSQLKEIYLFYMMG
jgi:hypothetical protein